MKEEETKHFRLFGLYFPFRRSLFLKLLLFVYISALLLLLISTQFFGYEMTDADIPGGLVAGVLLAYLIHMLVD